MAISASRENAQNATCKRWLQFSLHGLLIFFTLCAVFLGTWKLKLWSNVLFLLVFMEAVAVLGCVEILMRNLPSAIRASIARNTRRLDGTRSRRRERVEKRAQQKLRRSLLFVILLIVAPGNLLLYSVHAYVIPLPIGLDAVAAFSTTPANWKQSLRDDGIEQRYDKWHKHRPGALNATDTSTMKQFLWQNWPFVLAICAAWIWLSLFVLKSLYIAALREFAEEIRSRSEQYKIHDLARSSTREAALE